jgi:hypothetical protein
MKHIKLWIKRYEFKLIDIGTFRLGIRIQFFNWANRNEIGEI